MFYKIAEGIAWVRKTARGDAAAQQAYARNSSPQHARSGGGRKVADAERLPEA